MLVGHSVGATMAFQIALSSRIPWDPSSASEGDIKQPMGILGVEGIYDFPLILNAVPSEVRDMYLAPTRGAFGDNEETWLDVSPAQYSKEAYAREWRSGRRVAVVAHSPDDEMVGWEQVKAMQKVFESGEPDENINFQVLELKGKHDALWKKGQELAKAIGEALRVLKELQIATETRRNLSVGLETEVRERDFV